MLRYLYYLFYLTEAVRKNHCTLSASDKDIEEQIKDWLKFASERCGARRERMLKKSIQIQAPVDLNNNVRNMLRASQRSLLVPEM